MLTSVHFDPVPRRMPYQHEPVTVNLRHPPANLHVPRHSHEWAQIAYPYMGAIKVSAANTVWIVPPLRAVWIPPNIEHEVSMLGEVELRTIYVAPEAAPRPLDTCSVFEVSDLLRALFEALRTTELHLTGEAARRRHLLTELLLAEVKQAPSLSLGLPMPRDRRLQALCHALANDPGSSLTLEGWAKRVGGSSRTLARLFQKELGMGFGAWRQQLRLARAFDLIGRGNLLGDVAERMGYASQSAFSAMFRRTFGVPPSQFADDRSESSRRTTTSKVHGSR